MTRIFLACLAICIAAPAAEAQLRQGCLASARLERDACVRGAADDNLANRRCTDRYLNALNRCRTGVGVPRRSAQPRTYRVQPKVTPVQPRIRSAVPRIDRRPLRSTLPIRPGARSKASIPKATTASPDLR